MELDQQTADELRGDADWHKYQKKNLGPALTFHERVETMHTFRRIGRSPRYIPEFAKDDAMLKSVIVHAAVGYIYRNQPPAGISKDIAYWDAITKARSATYQASQTWQAIQDYLAAQTNCGGFMALHTAVAYRAWRLNWKDKDIADSLAIGRPGCVGQILRKLIRIAADLGYPTRKTWSFTNFANEDEIVELWKAGLTTTAISKKLNCCPMRVRSSLKRLGLFTYRRYPEQFKSARGKAEDIVALWQQGFGTVQIAHKLGTGQGTVVRVLKKRGLYVLRSNSVTGMAAVKRWETKHVERTSI